jgi:diaminopimelate decarboxylase
VTANPLAPSWLAEPFDANSIDPALWPASAVRTEAGELTIAGVGVDSLVERYGTPLYVVDEDDVRGRAADALAAFGSAFSRVGGRAKVYYAGKAFLSTEVARWVAEAGLNIDVCSGGELAVALAAGIDAARIGVHGNNKSLTEIDRAVAAGVGAIVIDSAQEIDRVAAAAERHSSRQRVRLRVNSGVHAHTHEFLATAHEDQKFGVPLEQTEGLVAAIRGHELLDFVGLHCHIGSQIFGSEGFAESAARLLAVHARLLTQGEVPELNLGGGFGIAYTSGDRPTPLAELADRIADVVSAECSRLGIPLPTVAFEPGRSIVGPAGVTLYTAGTTKAVEVGLGVGVGEGRAEPLQPESGVRTGSASAQRLYVSVDGGMSDNARFALYGAEYAVRMVNRTSSAPAVLVRIAGKHCESGDIVVDADYLPGDVAPGDVLAVPATGAYCWSLSSNYNYLPRPAVIAVRGGTSRVIVRGETEADLLAHDVGIEKSESVDADARRLNAEVRA